MWTTLSRTVLYGLLLYATYLMVLLSLPYLAFKPHVEFLETKQLIYHIDHWRWSFYVHVFSSVFVLITGIFQFNRYLIKNKPKIHRISGSFYFIVLFFFAAPSGLIMSFYANGGIPAQIGFVLMGSLWILTSVIALIKIKQGRYEEHGNWVLRSYALTLAAITLRLYGYLFDVFKLSIPPKETYILLAYVSWIPNLIIAEIMIRTGFIKRRIY